MRISSLEKNRRRPDRLQPGGPRCCAGSGPDSGRRVSAGPTGRGRADSRPLSADGNSGAGRATEKALSVFLV